MDDWLEIQVFDAEEIAAVLSGELDGTVYEDMREVAKAYGFEIREIEGQLEFRWKQ